MPSPRQRVNCCPLSRSRQFTFYGRPDSLPQLISIFHISRKPVSQFECAGRGRACPTLGQRHNTQGTASRPPTFDGNFMFDSKTNPLLMKMCRIQTETQHPPTNLLRPPGIRRRIRSAVMIGGSGGVCRGRLLRRLRIQAGVAKAERLWGRGFASDALTQTVKDR
jgi:hypothetical protein